MSKITADSPSGGLLARQGRAEHEEHDLSFDAVVFNSLRTLTAWFASLMLVFAALDPWILGDVGPHSPGSASSSPHGEWLSVTTTQVMALAVAIAIVLAATFAWLTVRPPSVRWANAIAFAVGSVGLARAVSYVLASPNALRTQLLFTLIIAAGCIFLSRRWFTAFLLFAVLTWYAVAFGRAPDEEWHRTILLTASAVGIASVVLTIRRQSILALQASRAFDQRARGELSARAHRGEMLSTISARFVKLSHDGFEEAAEVTLRELGETIGVDHAFLCRVDENPLRTSVVHEWAAHGRTARKAEVQNIPLDVQPWFRRRFLAGQITDVPDVARLPAEANVEKTILESLGTRAFLATPLVRERETPWGYMGVVQNSSPRTWSRDEVNLIRVVGDILLSALERHRAENEVRRSEERFRRLFESELIGMFFADVYGNITEANGAFLKITGYETSDLPLRWDRLSPPEWHRHDEAAVLRLLKDGVDHPWEKEFFHKRGHRISILIGGAVMAYDRGECVSFILDLTEQKKAEQKIQQLNAELERTARLGVMGEMAAGLAHEVHQPLAAIMNYAAGARERLTRGRLKEEELAEVLAEIVEQSRRAGSVIRNIRDFVRRRHPVSRPVDLNAAVRECLRLLQFEIRQREVGVRTELADRLPDVLADATQLSQVLLNLMLNGLQAMETAEQTRTLSVRTSTADQVVSVEVSDTGIGIAADAESRLFDQFFTTKPDGLGMGLPISRSITESHGGTLVLARTGPDGTSFVLHLPAAESRQADNRREQELATKQ